MELVPPPAAVGLGTTAAAETTSSSSLVDPAAPPLTPAAARKANQFSAKAAQDFIKRKLIISHTHALVLFSFLSALCARPSANARYVWLADMT